MVAAAGDTAPAAPGWRRPTSCCAAGSSFVGLLLLGALPGPRGTSAAAVGGPPADFEDQVYAYRDYTATLKYFDQLKRRCPDIIDTWIAQDEFPEILPAGPKSKWASCGSSGTCKTLIVRIANRAKLTDTTPEVFFSGALHGNERLGPLVVTELAGFLCSRYKAGDEDIRRLVDGRSTWISPMTNAHGFAKNTREENGMDPNRDFPYLQIPEHCMMTQTARTVNELFRRHLFQFELTFHGGMRALTYEWGSLNHMHNRKSTESPDDRAFTTVGVKIQEASGLDSSSRKWYPLGRINDLVYPVNGGMEDWSYGAGWEASPRPITVCRPRTYGGYDPKRTVYNPGSIAALVYLAEMDDFKTPPASTLGRSSELWGQGTRDGHVARNMRMCLKMIELAKPEVVVHRPSWPDVLLPGARLQLRARGFGCLSMQARLVLLPRAALGSSSQADAPCELGPEAWGNDAEKRKALLALAVPLAEVPSSACQGLQIWQKREGATPYVHLDFEVPAAAGSGTSGGGGSSEFCVAVAAEFDQEWGQQTHPDPAVRPRSHAARARLDDHYIAVASDGPMRIDEYRTKLFPVLPSIVRLGTASEGSIVTAQVAVTAAGGEAAPQQPAASPPAAPVAASAAGNTAASAAEVVGAVSAAGPPLAVPPSQPPSSLTGPADAVAIAGTDQRQDSVAALLVLAFTALVATLCACNMCQAWRLLTRKSSAWRWRLPRVSSSAATTAAAGRPPPGGGAAVGAAAMEDGRAGERPGPAE